MTKALVSTLSFLLFTATAFGTPNSLILEGKLVDSSGTPVEAASVDFTIQVFSPSPNDCLLYEEVHSIVNMTGSGGMFSLSLGSGTRPGSNFEHLNTLTSVFNNSSVSFAGATCGGTAYTSAPGDTRYIHMEFDAGSGLEVVGNDIEVASAPFAMSAASIDGITSSDLLKVNTASGMVLTQANLEWLFATNPRFTELQALLNGTSSQYLTSTPATDMSMAGNKITNVATPSLNTDATNKIYVDTNIGGKTVDAATLSGLAPGNAGEVLTWSGTQWTATVAPVDSTKLPLAGGTMTGAINMGANDLTNIGNTGVTGTLNVTGASTLTGNVIMEGDVDIKNASYLTLYKTGNANSVSIAPSNSMTANYMLTLPPDDGNFGDVLQTDGSGVLTWVAGGGGGVTQIFGRVGNITATYGDYSATLITSAATGDVAATDVQSAIAELDAEKLPLAGGEMTGPLTLAAANEMQFKDADGSHHVGFKAPNNITAVGSFTWELPSDDGTPNQVLKTNGAGVLSWHTIPAATIPEVIQDVDSDTKITVDSASIDEDMIRFFTGGSQQMNLDLNGRLGVGTMAPVSKLQVEGDIQVGYEGAICDTLKEGAIRYNAGILEYCDGVTNPWKPLASSIDSLSDATRASGTGNIGFGNLALDSMVSGSNNLAMGNNALRMADGAGFNLGFGANALQSLSTGSYNIALGGYALQSATTGVSNIAIGNDSLNALAVGDSNIAIGRDAASLLGSGDDNILIGENTGASLTGGTNNILIGAGVDVPTGSINDFLNIGDTIFGDISGGYIGIKTNSPSAELDVNGDTHVSGELIVDGNVATSSLFLQNTPLPACNIGQIHNDNGVIKVCILDHPSGTPIWQVVKRTHCPDGWVWAGTPGDSTSICVSQINNGPYQSAHDTCGNDDARLCSRQQLMYYRKKLGGALPAASIAVSDMVYEAEFKGMLVDNNAMPSGIIAQATWPAATDYLCCID